MKVHIESLCDGLAYLLQGLLFIEINLSGKYRHCEANLCSQELKKTMEGYLDSCHDHELKIDRIFSYLMKEKAARTNEVFNKITAETQFMLDSASIPGLKDILFIGCIESMISYKISSYRTAYLFAAELQLDTPCDLIQQILESEYSSRKMLSNIAIGEFNRSHLS
jgi:ferritin-like metal-binding protein YciE